MKSRELVYRYSEPYHNSGNQLAVGEKKKFVSGVKSWWRSMCQLFNCRFLSNLWARGLRESWGACGNYQLILCRSKRIFFFLSVVNTLKLWNIDELSYLIFYNSIIESPFRSIYWIRIFCLTGVYWRITMNMRYTVMEMGGGGGGCTLVLYGFQPFHLGPQQSLYYSFHYSCRLKCLENTTTISSCWKPSVLKCSLECYPRLWNIFWQLVVTEWHSD